jgi:hypothetical protein
MSIPEILKALERCNRHFPLAAMSAAIEQREAITPELLALVEAIAANPTEFAQRGNYMQPVFALYLLAQFREKRAYPAIVKMVSAPGETAYQLVGDTVAEGLNRILASVYDGNPAALHGLVENEEADEFVRDAGINALLVLEHTGQMARTEVVEYFRSLFHGKLQRTNSFVWNGLVGAVAALPAPELLEEVRQAYSEGLVDESFKELEEVEGEMAAPDPSDREGHTLITDAIGEMEDWVCFNPEDSSLAEPPEVQFPAPPQPAPTEYVTPKPFIRETKIGRNDPCPCGSGKKYKKCCLK